MVLTDFVRQQCGIQPTFQWVGLWQDVERGAIELVFAATMDEAELSGMADWSLARTAPLNGLDAEYVERVKATYMRDPVWNMLHDSGLQQGETIQVDERKSHGIG